MMQKHAFPPLFRYSYVTAHLIIEQITVIDDPGFQNECLDSMSVFAYFYLSKVPVIEIGSDKMLIVMLVSIKRVFKIVAFDLLID